MPQRKKLTFERASKLSNGKYKLVTEDRRYKYTIIPHSSGSKVRLEVRTKRTKFPKTAIYETYMDGAKKVAEAWNQGKIKYKGNAIVNYAYIPF